MHSVNNTAPAGAPPGSVAVALDGSAAALVPARRAMTWQLTDAAGNPVVRERYWVTFQPGEIRVCTSCHGANETDQASNGPSQNAPQALLALVNAWKQGAPPLPEHSLVVPAVPDARP